MPMQKATSRVNSPRSVTSKVKQKAREPLRIAGFLASRPHQNISSPSPHSPATSSAFFLGPRLNLADNVRRADSNPSPLPATFRYV